jgi:transposase InsO family protein
VGYDFAHAIVDDHSRLAFVELHTDEKAATVTAFLARALSWFALHGIDPKRLMSDNAWAYTHNRSLAELLAANEIKHLRTKPYRPQTNEKVERFHQTMARECAYGLSYRRVTGDRGSKHGTGVALQKALYYGDNGCGYGDDSCSARYARPAGGAGA